MDLLARAVEDALGGRAFPIDLQRDDGFIAELWPSAFIDDRFPGEDALLARARGRILDAGCGAGRLALPLQQAGHTVTGLEISPGLCAVSRQRGLRDVRRGDVWGKLDGPWDTIVLAGNNIGIAGSLAGAGRLLAHLAAALGPGGVVLLTSLDVTATTERVHLDYHARNRRAGRDVGAVRLRVVYRGARGPWFDWLHVAPAEVEPLATAAGLTTEIVAALPTGNYAAALTRRT
jgi:SAM-dependent methyltransferase